MPDHFHLLVNPSGDGESIGDIVGRTKKSQWFAVRNAHQVFLRFQEAFWDHVLGLSGNIEEEFESIVWYIRENPVKAGLVAQSDEYPFLL
jgi:Transposase and inactivated derivatives